MQTNMFLALTVLMSVSLTSANLANAQGTDSAHATEYVHVQQIDGVWWFIGPDGDKFVSLGVNHIEPHLWLAPYNKAATLDRYGQNLVTAGGRFDTTSTAAKKWIDRQVEICRDLHFNTFGKHTVAERYSAPFQADGHSENRSKFFGQIMNFDEILGRLLDALQKNNLAENTIIIFMGDNGTAEGSNGLIPDDGFNAGMRGKKASVYEGGHRVACFVRCPGRLNAGQQVRQLTSCRDWLPTLIDLCGLNATDGKRFDGQSLKPLLEGKTDDWPSRTLFVQRPADQPKLLLDGNGDNPWRTPHYCVLTEKWRLVDGELYNINDDPSQTNDLATQYPEIVHELKSSYRQHFADVFRDDAPNVRFQLGDPHENPTLLTVRDWHSTIGRVIWKQEQLDDDTLAINGFWAVDVTQPGRYEIRLARFPEDSPASMGATKAVLRIGDQKLEKQVSRRDRSVTFEFELPAGPAILQSWLSDDEGVVRGAYFVSVKKI